MRFNTVVHEDLITPQLLDLVRPYAAKLVFKKQYLPFFECIASVRNSRVMLPR